MLIPLRRLARELGVPYPHLKGLVEQGRIPVVRTTRQVLADRNDARRALDLEAGARRGFTPVRLASLSETAAYIGLSIDQIRLLAEGGAIPSFQAGRSWLFQVEEVHHALFRKGGAMVALKEIQDAQAHSRS